MTWRLGGFALAVILSAAPVQAAELFPDDLPPSLVAGDEVLPGGREVCRRIGLDPEIPGRCNSIAVLGRSARQTDRSLWFSKSTTASGPDAGCPDAIAFSRSTTGGSVESLCHDADPDAVITPEDLAALAAEAARLNAIPRKTLAEHRRALDLKTEIDCMTGQHLERCD